MRRTVIVFALALAVLGLTIGVQAAEEKEQTLKGTITCAKCDLGLQKTCATVIKVGEKVYYFDTASNKKYHKNICQTPKEGTVTGEVGKQGEKLTVKVKKVEFKED